MYNLRGIGILQCKARQKTVILQTVSCKDQLTNVKIMWDEINLKIVDYPYDLSM